MLAREAEFSERLLWTLDRLREHQTATLRVLLRHAVNSSPWHAQRLQGVDPDSFELDDLPRLPTMTKADLVANFDDIVTDRRLSTALAERHLASLDADAYALGRYHVVASGGTSGLRGVFVYDWEAWPTFYLSLHRFFQRGWKRDPALEGVPQRAAVVAASHATHMSSALAQTFTRPGAELRSVPAIWSLERIVAELNQWQPTILQGYPSILRQLCAEARAGRLQISPRRIRTRSETLRPEVRVDLEDTFRVPVHNEWVCTEGATAATCGLGPGQHLSEDLVLIEPVSAAGDPIAAGALSDKVLLTNLYNLTVPLIRYELTDQMRFLNGDCPCGTALRRIEEVQGRFEDLFDYGAGVQVHPIVLASPLLRDRAIVSYQVSQTHTGAEITVVASGPIDTGRIRSEIAAGLSGLGLPDPVISIRHATDLQRTAAGKVRQFIPLPSPPPS
jgi:phenylacetate-CoA ligase